MGKFISDDFMLSSDAARELYHNTAAKQPIIDYHCHLDPKLIAEDYRFDNISTMWLGGDHYKWRAMRANGVGEEYITGDAQQRDKFMKWAETVPYTMRNPLYHWTHLELSRAFGINEILKPQTAGKIYDECNDKLQSPEFSVHSLIEKFAVEVICTTDDPADTLEYHRQIRQSDLDTKVLPTWRPDNAVNITADTAKFREYIIKLGKASDTEISTFKKLIDALQSRHDFFAEEGCRLSDHGMDTFYAEEFTTSKMSAILDKALAGKELTGEEVAVFRSGMLHILAEMDAEKGWTQQFHIGVVRNNNSAMFAKVGPDTGFDSMHDLPCALAGNRFFDRLASSGKLAKTIVYNLNPKDTEVLATMIYNFNDGTIPGKMQLGSGWWFLDQENGMRRQIEALSSLGLLSRFVGMLTDSRSFLSYTRHKYFRRILCEVIGSDIESGRLPSSEMDFIHGMVADISYRNARGYFGF